MSTKVEVDMTLRRRVTALLLLVLDNLWQFFHSFTMRWLKKFCLTDVKHLGLNSFSESSKPWITKASKRLISRRNRNTAWQKYGGSMTESYFYFYFK